MASEFTLIDEFVRLFPDAGVMVGPGDDCAVLAPSRHPTCVTTDAVVEDVHFTRGRFRLEDVGYKALAVNLSDIAAMGAKPRWFLCSLELPPETDKAEVTRLARGMAVLAKQHAVKLVGGNISSAQKLSITLTVAGEVQRPGALLRSGGKAGDIVFVSGTLGDARLGMMLLAAQEHAPYANGNGKRRSNAIQRQLRPQPKVALGLLARKFANAAIDVSDGMAQDLSHLCHASHVGADVDMSRLPLSVTVREHFSHRGGDEAAARFALIGGEDYELILAVSPKKAAAFERACERLGEKVTRIGTLQAKKEVRFHFGDKKEVLFPRGFDHFENN